MNAICWIAAAGSFQPNLLPPARKEDFWIAADAGYRSLREAGIKADLFVGDGDSLHGIPEGVEQLVLPVVKDDTDTMAAVRCALQRGYRRIGVFGALGGSRPSHSLANVQTLLFAVRNGGRAALLDARCVMMALTPEQGPLSLPEPCVFFSLFTLSGPAEVSVRGAKYSGERIRLTPDFPLGVSNERGDGCAITVLTGTVLLVCEPGEGRTFAGSVEVLPILEAGWAEPENGENERKQNRKK